MRALLLGCLFATSALALPACVEADLGDVPVYCNPWEPRCPDGYTCVPLARDGKTEEVCQREGASAASGVDWGLALDEDGAP